MVSSMIQLVPLKLQLHESQGASLGETHCSIGKLYLHVLLREIAHLAAIPSSLFVIRPW